MYDENKWNETEQNENSAVTESSAETSEVRIEDEKNVSEPVIQNGVNTQVDETSGTYRWSKYQDQGGQQAQNAGQAYGQNQQTGQNYDQPNPNTGSTYSQPNPNTGSTYGQPNQPYGQYGQQPYGQYQQAGGYQNNVNGQNRQPYNNPYQNRYYQNQNRAPQNGSGGSGKKKGSLVKKTVLLAAGALLFGTVAGATMFGVNRAGQLLFPVESQNVTAETEAALETTPVVNSDDVQASVQNTSSGVVIEDVSEIVDMAMPSVVAITNTTLYKSSTWFGQTQTYEVPSSGSGIIVGENDTELLIVTNNHVIEDSTSISVTFIDESTVDAAIKGTDAESDLAVIAVPLDQISADTKAQIKAATMGDSDSLKMGQGVIAIGNALGLGQSVTVGHVSALNREITVDGNTKSVIQTDAAINPGNSGGALLNAKGELIGINEAKYSDESVEGVGYAIPISYAKDIIEDLKLRTTKVEVDESEQGYLGIQVQNIDSVTAQMYGMPEGVYVYKITENSAASESDLREKDIITKFDGESVTSNADLTNLLTYYKAGTTVTLTVQSLENGEYVERQVEITLKNRPQETDSQSGTQGQQNMGPQGQQRP